MPTVLDAFVRFMADTKDIDKATKPGGKIDQAAEQSGKRAGGKLSTVLGTGMQKAMTGAGVAGGLMFDAAIRGATEFEDQLATINTVADMTPEKLKATGDEIQALSRETGKSTDDLTAGYYDLVSAGVDSADAMAVLKDS